MVNVIPLQSFLRDFKYLKKAYHSIKDDVDDLVLQLKKNPIQGIPPGKDCYKIRMAIASKGRGKSGGARVITCVKIVRQTVHSPAMFDKSEMENLSDEELNNRLNQIVLP